MRAASDLNVHTCELRDPLVGRGHDGELVLARPVLAVESDPNCESNTSSDGTDAGRPAASD
jgi:hypothetical protein